MTGEQPDPLKVQFDRIVARLNADAGKPAGQPVNALPVRPVRRRMDDVAFALSWLTVIIALSVLVGGLIGLVVVIAAAAVSVRLMFT